MRAERALGRWGKWNLGFPQLSACAPSHHPSFRLPLFPSSFPSFHPPFLLFIFPSFLPPSLPSSLLPIHLSDHTSFNLYTFQAHPFSILSRYPFALISGDLPNAQPGIGPR